MVCCFLCDEHLTDTNKSKEHILLNALGGRLTSKNLICKDCNSKCGNTSDAVLANQLAIFASLLNVKRDRGIPPAFEAHLVETGEKILISSDGNAVFRPKPPIETKLDENTINIQLSVPDLRSARNQLLGLKRKYPKIVIDEFLEKAQFQMTEPGIRYEFNMPGIGGPDARRSACRSIVNYYLFQHGECRFVKHLFPLIKGISGSTKELIGFYYPNQMHYTLMDDEVAHSLIVIGRPKEKLLFGLIEYFNVLSYLVILNEEYTGIEFQTSYIYDLVSSAELSIEPKLNELSASDIRECCSRSALQTEDVDGIEKRMNLFAKKLGVIQGQKKRIREILLSNLPQNVNASDFSNSETDKFVDKFFSILKIQERSQIP